MAFPGFGQLPGSLRYGTNSTPPRSYTLETFAQYGHNKFFAQYNAVAQESIYTYEQKNYYDGNDRLQSGNLLLVAHYHFKAGGPPVWAHSDGYRVLYYFGREGYVKRLSADFKSKIYYDQPFSFLAGSQEAEGMTPARQLGQQLVEVVIHFLYLKKGLISSVRSSQCKDTLRLFKVACLNFETNQQTYANTQTTTPRSRTYRKEDTLEFGDLLQVPYRAKASHGIKKEPDSDTTLSKRPAPAPTARKTERSGGTSQCRRSSLVEHLQFYESTLHKKLLQQRSALQNEVQELKAKLACQEQTTADVNATLATERRKRKALELSERKLKGECKDKASESSRYFRYHALQMRDTKKWKDKYTQLKRKLADLTEDEPVTPSKFMKR